MIRNILFVSLWSMLLFYSCIDDDSTLPIKDISEINGIRLCLDGNF